MKSHILKKSEALALRRKGFSYGQIMKKLGLTSKGTLSSWLRNIELDENSIKLLSKNKELAVKRGLENFNKVRSKEIFSENMESLEEGQVVVASLSKRDLLLIGAALYWGEGTKAERKGETPQLVFTNSDPAMVKVFISFLKGILLVPLEKIRSGIHIYPNTDEIAARKYWSRITGLGKERFYIVRQVSRASMSKRPYNSLPYGTLVVKVSSRSLFFRVKGMISGIIKNTK